MNIPCLPNVTSFDLFFRDPVSVSDQRWSSAGASPCGRSFRRRLVEPHGHSPWYPTSRPSGATSRPNVGAFIHGHSPRPSAAGAKCGEPGCPRKNFLVKIRGPALCCQVECKRTYVSHRDSDPQRAQHPSSEFGRFGWAILPSFQPQYDSPVPADRY